jgi:hypothetical protein
MTSRNASLAGNGQAEDLPAKILVESVDLASLVEFYWIALHRIQNTLEDIEGADDRLEYLKGLRVLLIEYLQEMDGVLSGGTRVVETLHSLPYALEHGISFLGLSGAQLAQAVGFHDDELDFPALQTCLRNLCRSSLATLPGSIPDAQGNSAQREILRAIRGWSAVANDMSEDLGFLKSRLQDM